MTIRNKLCALAVLSLLGGCAAPEPTKTIQAASTPKIEVPTTNKTDTKKETKPMSTETITKTDEEWRKELSPEEYDVLRKAGTERAFTGKYDNHHETGTYVCKGCGTELFTSDAKFDSGCGWPSFYEGISKDKIVERDDSKFGMRRVEVVCAKCGGHLGHVFPDGPKPTGLRYCINSASLGFQLKEEAQK